MASGSQTLRDSLLPAVDIIRGIPAILGLRPHIVTVRVRTWDGARPELGAPTDVDSPLKVDVAIANVKVRNVTQKEIVASAGLYTQQTLVVGPITPPYLGSRVDNDQINIFDPPVGTSALEVFFQIQGPGYNGTPGDWFKKVAQRTDQPFRYMLWLEKTGWQI
jgi:hypothetical protein